MSTSLEMTRLIRQWMEASTNRSLHEWMRFVKASGLSMQQFGILMNLRHHQACGITDIGALMDTSPAAASQLVDKLVQAGLVERVEDPQDRRAKLLNLTQKGHALIAAGIQARSSWVDELVTHLSPADYESVAGALNTLMQAAQRIEIRKTEKHG